MNRAPRHQTGRSRRWTTGVTLVAAAALAVIATTHAAFGVDHVNARAFPNPDVDDPYRCGTALTSASMYRRPLPSSNLKFLSAVMWDGRASKPGQAIRDGLINQIVNAVTVHAEGPTPSPAQVQSIVDFELGLFPTQVADTSS